MRAVRAAVRLAALAAVAAALSACLLVALPFAALAGRGTRRLRARVASAFGAAAVRIVGLRLEVTGTPPSGPFLAVSNHLSYVDVIVLSSLAPGVFVAKSEVRRWPVLGVLARLAGTVFVDRARPGDLPRALDALRGVRREGCGIYVFPEGTSTRGDTVLPFRSALLDLAARDGLDVTCIALRYATEADLAGGRGAGPRADEAVCWWGRMTLVPHLLRLLGLPRIHGCVTIAAERAADTDRKRMAARLRQTVQSMLARRDEAETACLPGSA